MHNFTKRQQNIIDAAISIIANSGLQNLSIRNIARRVGVNESTIYSHFKSKDAILECIIETYMHNAVDWTREFDQNGKSSLNKLELYYNRLSSKHISAANRARVYWLGLINSSGITFEKVKAVHLYYKLWLLRTLEEGQKDGEIRDDFSADDLLSLIVGNIYLYCRRAMFDKDYDIEKNSPATWKMIETLLSENSRSGYPKGGLLLVGKNSN